MNITELRKRIAAPDGDAVVPSAWSQPIPVREADRVVIVGFHGSWRRFDDGVHFSGPHDKYVFDAETGALLRHEDMPYGAVDLGTARVMRHQGPAARDALKLAHDDAFGPLLEAFARGGPRPSSLDQEAAAVRAYLEAVILTAEMPYYRSIGAEWFAWLGM
jgi:hypothetical protein